MTAFNVSMLLTANASQAKQELKSASADVQAFGAAAKSAGTTAAAGLKAAEAGVVQLKRSTAGVSSGLVAQFNDVGQMLLAGQSPLLLAAQQGTQISQVLGPLGARGAVAALGEAFVGMVSPINLAVFAAVAGLGLLGSTLQGLVGETKSVEDAFGDLDTATKEWRQAASVGIGDLKAEFGTVTPELIDLQRRMTELKLAEMLLSAAEAARTLGEALHPGLLDLDSVQGNIADLLNVPEFARRTGRGQKVTPQVAEFDRQMATLQNSTDTGAQIAALQRMQQMLVAAAAAQGEMNKEQKEFYNQTIALERQLQVTRAAQEGIGSAQQLATAQAERMLGTLRDEANIRQQASIWGENSRIVAEARVEAERRVFEATLATLDVSDQVKTHLRDAWEAANGLEATSSGVASELRNAADQGSGVERALRDAALVIAGAADATNIWVQAMAGVAAEARAIGAALSSLGSAGIANASKEVELAALRSGKSAAEARRSAQEAQIRDEAKVNELKVGHILANAVMKEKLDGVELDRQLDGARKVASERDKAGRRGATSAARQGDRNDRYLESLRAERDALREIDPVQKELIRNRERLSQLSASQRAEAEQLIVTNAKLAEQQKSEKDAWKEIGDAAFDALDGLIRRGESAADVMSRLADTIAQALLQSALLGTGPLAGLFGGQGTGLFDVIGGALGIPSHADGGFISGAGGPRDDKILSWLSNGEYVVNAAATARHRPLLEAINRAPGFATGGFVGGAALAGAAGGQATPIVIDLRMSPDLDARIAETSRDVSVKVMRGGLEEYDAKVLPRRMQAIGADPRRVG